MFKKLILSMMFVCFVAVAFIPSTTIHAEDKKAASSDAKFDSDITDKSKVYNSQDEGVKKLNAPFIKLVQIVGGIGGTVFVLLLMVIAGFIFVGSLTPRMRSFAWMALGSCCMGGFIFYGAAVFAEAIAGIAVS